MNRLLSGGAPTEGRGQKGRCKGGKVKERKEGRSQDVREDEAEDELSLDLWWYRSLKMIRTMVRRRSKAGTRDRSRPKRKS